MTLLRSSGPSDQFDVIATVSGGGLSGQAGAVRRGISQALAKFEPELRGAMKQSGFLTRDSRVVERKKYGRAGAPPLPVLQALRTRFLPSLARGGITLEGRRKAPFFLHHWLLCRSSPWGLRGAGV